MEFRPHQERPGGERSPVSLGRVADVKRPWKGAFHNCWSHKENGKPSPLLALDRSAGANLTVDGGTNA